MLFWKTVALGTITQARWVRTGGDFTVWIQGAPGFTQDAETKMEQPRSAKSLSWLKEPKLLHSGIAQRASPMLASTDSWIHACLQEMAKDSSIR